MRKSRYSIDDVREAINCSKSIAGVLRILNLRPVNTDNRKENLLLLCPNCHALTDNYRGRARLSALSEKRDVECRKFKEALTGKADGNLEPSLQQKEGAETRHDTPKGIVPKVKE